MDINLTYEETRLVEFSKGAIIKYNKMRHVVERFLMGML